MKIDINIKLSNGTINGYRYFYDPKHPLANKSGIVYYHRLIASKKIKRFIKENECVHHIDGNKNNNDESNIKITSKSKHTSLHNKKHKKALHCLICGKFTSNKKFCSYKCSRFSTRKFKWPTKEQLKKDIEDIGNFVMIGIKYGVSSVTIRKLANKYELFY